MNKLLIIEGNMASGKSGLLRWISHLHQGIECISMDELRTRAFLNYSMDTEAREEWCRRRIADRLRSHTTSSMSGTDILALERIGTGKFDAEIDTLIDSLDIEYKRVLVDTPPRTCLLWQQQRKPSIYPRPHYMSEPEVFIYRTAEGLKERIEHNRYKLIVPGVQHPRVRAEKVLVALSKWLKE